MPILAKHTHRRIEGQNHTQSIYYYFISLYFFFFFSSFGKMILMRWNWFLLRPAPFSIKRTLNENSFLSFDWGLCGNMKISTQIAIPFFSVYGCFISIGHMLSSPPLFRKLISGKCGGWKKIIRTHNWAWFNELSIWSGRRHYDNKLNEINQNYIKWKKIGNIHHGMLKFSKIQENHKF